MRFLFAAVALNLACAPVQAQDPGPTLEKCACQLDEKPTPGEHGARATNATLCVQTFDRQRRWCEITIECLRGNLGPNCKFPTSARASLAPLYEAHIKQVSADQSPMSANILKYAPLNYKYINDSSRQNEKLLQTCLLAYGKRDPIGIREKDFSCSVDRESRWLQITYDLGAQLVRFSFAPPE